MPHDGARLTGLGPATGLGPPSFSFWHGYEADFGRALLRSCHLGDGTSRREDLARRAIPVDVVGTSDGPRPGAVRRLFADRGVGGEPRLLLRDGRGVWGTLGLLRTRGARPFRDEDLHKAAWLGPVLAAVLRRFVTAGPLVATTPRPPRGVFVLGPDHGIKAATPAVLAWRAQWESHLRAPEWTGGSFFAAMSVLSRTRAAAPLVLGPAASHGRWTACQTEPLDADGAGDVAVVVQAADAAQRLPSFCSSCGMTARERQVLEHLHTGAAPKHVARRLDLSTHTVNDHLKAIFRKTGARGRDELIAAING